MKNIFTKSVNKMPLVFSFIFLIGFIVASPATRVQSFQNVEQKDPATAIANICAALLESCARQPSICGLTDTPSSKLLVDLYKDGVADIMALNLEPAPTDIALAKGIIKASLIAVVGRQPELQGDLEQLEAMCNEDVESLMK